MNKYLVTGGSGFIGTNLVRLLQARGNNVLNFDLCSPRDSEAKSVWVKGDLLDPSRLTEVFQSFRPDVVIHLGARTDFFGESLDDYSSNTLGVKNLCDCLQRFSIPRAILASSRLVNRIDDTPADLSIYSPPNWYGESKVLGEQIVKHSNLHTAWIIVRPTSIWGPWFSVPYRNFFDNVLRRTYLHPRGETIRKSFGYVGNAVHQLYTLSELPVDEIDRKTVYLADHSPLDLRVLADCISDSAGQRRSFSTAPTVLKAIARAGDLSRYLGVREPPLTSFRLENLRTSMVYDLRETERLVGPLPFTMVEGVEQTLSWMGRESLKRVVQ